MSTENAESKIKIKREARGLSQEQLAELCQVSQQHISWWEKGGRNPASDSLKKLAAALDCKVDDLI